VIHFLILHVTAILVVAFFVLWAASKAEGLVAIFGNILGAWLVLVALLHVVGFFMPGMMGMRGMEPGMMHDGSMQGHWMHHWGETPAGPGQPAAPTKP
jgi:hypothetical protein